MRPPPRARERGDAAALLLEVLEERRRVLGAGDHDRGDHGEQQDDPGDPDEAPREQLVPLEGGPVHGAEHYPGAGPRGRESGARSKTATRKPTTATTAITLKLVWTPWANESRTIRSISAAARAGQLGEGVGRGVGPGEGPVQDRLLVAGQRRPPVSLLTRSPSWLSDELVKIAVETPRPTAPPAIWNM